ncbi:hypothetical protein ACFWWC_35275 [Streptomyces sp. NPDC058642]|uniref:hypothetical protein n=1 Tax=Streptomyces sp. NPDC058642 TaxID=3346572 RepID=UPI003653F18F
MNSVPKHLLVEDRQEYERILGEALRTAPHHPELAAVGQRLNPEQLRTMALNATALITTAAATEYQHYVKVRDEMRQLELSLPPVRKRSVRATGLTTRWRSAPAPHALPRSVTRPAGTARGLGLAVLGIGRPVSRRISDGVSARQWAAMPYGRRLLAAVLGLRVRPEAPTAAQTKTSRIPAPEVTGTGRIAEFAAPTAVLTGVVTAIFFLVGLLLKMLSAESAAARTMISAGWLFGAVTVGGIVVYAVVWLLASRWLPSKESVPRLRAPGGDAWDRYLSKGEQVARAQEAWRKALLERGILPFLREALGGPSTGPRRHTPPSAPTNRLPKLGDDRSLVSPDYTSPDLGGPGQPE